MALEEFTVHEIKQPSSKPPQPRRNESRIKVIVRKRPLNAKEDQNKEMDIIECHPDGQSVTIAEPRTRVDLSKFIHNHDFMYDAVYDLEATNLDIYNDCCQPLINKVFQGSKATCFAYGQTGSGKSYTMLGQGSANPGLYVQAADDIYRALSAPQYEHLRVRVSFYEIYGEKLFDLLQNRASVTCREDRKQKVNIVGLVEKPCPTCQDLLDAIYMGSQMRQTGCTGANSQSSRSHAVLSIELCNATYSKPHGRFAFIDLAGSERGADTYQNSRTTRKEGADINKSLLALKECIRAMDQKATHTPFRQSMLTRVLKDSFIGNAYTLMIANVSPSSGSSENSLNTLRYADRFKELKKGGSGSKKGYDAYMPHRGGAVAQRGRELAAKSSSTPSLHQGSRGSSNQLSHGSTRPSSAEVNRQQSSGREPLSNPAASPTMDSKDRGNRNRSWARGSPDSRVQRPGPSLSSARSRSDSSGRRRHQTSSGNRNAVRSPPGQGAAPVTIAPPLDDTLRERQRSRTKQQPPASANSSGVFKEEDQLVQAHRSHIDEYMVLIKEDMQLLKNFDRMEVTTEKYISQLRTLLDKKSKAIDDLWRTVGR